MMLIISFCVSISWKRPVRRIISHVRGSRSLRKKRIKPNTTPTWARANCPRFSRRERKPHRNAARSLSNETFYTNIAILQLKTIMYESFTAVLAGTWSLWEGSRGCHWLCTTIHGGNGVCVRPITGGGEEEDQLPETNLPVHSQTPRHYQQWEV